MSNPYVGEIRLFAGNFAPQGWLFCDGSLVAITENPTLFQLIGTTYGGDGQRTFALPDLRGRVPIHQGSGLVIGQSGGSETVTLNTLQLPAHVHHEVGNGSASASSPAGNVLANPSANAIFTTDAPGTPLAGNAPQGGSQPHNNLQPYACVTYIISAFGIFPTQS